MTIEIMMIDDDADEILVTRYLLERRSEDIRICAYLEPDEALVELERRLQSDQPGPDLVTLDINMPRHNGIELASHIRPICEQLGSDVGVLTGSINPADEAAAYDAEVKFFATKPFNADVLKAIGDTIGRFSVRTEGRRIFVQTSPDAQRGSDKARHGLIGADNAGA